MIRKGHPWVFAESIREQSRTGQTGELSVVFDRKDQFLALGLYDPDSPIRLRIVHCGKPASIDADWWRERLRISVAKRAVLFDAGTNGGRLINGETDQFPALVLDRYAETLVMKLYSAIWFPRLEELTSIIKDELNPERVVLRLSRNIGSAARGSKLHDGQMLIGSQPTHAVRFVESGLCFEADVLKGQKTGFFLDQRENRRIVETLSAGREVLNAFSFSGGFSLYAARGGASAVTDLDISAHALDSSKRNFSLNADPTIQRCEHRLIQADVFEWLQKADPARYDLVILDPPSMARRESERSRALKAYANLARSGIALARKGGIVLCCSCSAHIRSEEFFDMLQTAARSMSRKIDVMQTTGQPMDHPATFCEAEYLKAVYLKCG
jgi:23S rRNA (cytosine1962-C5)-methyltransferase